MADQCIVCLENLDCVESSPLLPSGSGSGDPLAPELPAPAVADPAAPPAEAAAVDNHDKIAVIQVCGHTLHDSCLREWTGKANSCPICRQAFHLVDVYDKVGGTALSSYKVEDRKQVAEFDPQAWLDDNPDLDDDDEQEARPCPVCGQTDQEEVLLLCDGCDTPYHTFCIGLEGVPRGSWFCMECAEHLGDVMQAVQAPPAAAGQGGRRRRRPHAFFPRTQASMRRARRRARPDEWQGAWGEITNRIWDALNLDLDSNDGDDALLEEYQRSRQLREIEQREYRRWQQRLNIARRLGAQDVFAQNIPNGLIQQPASSQASQGRPHSTAETVTPQSRAERRAWGALERARESHTTSPGGRKRKSRSATASPVERAPEPERKLKRPRTRRITTQTEAPSLPTRPERSGNASSAASASASASASVPASNARSPRSAVEAPSFLSSLLKEVEMSTPSDDENIRNLFADSRPAVDASSPGSSPTVSTHNSPRALSTTPPPHRALRPTSPTSLSSHIEPVYPPANYSPTRSAGGDASDSEHRSPMAVSELRQPRPRRQQPIALPRSPDASPTRIQLSLEMKESISGMVRNALKPHWKSSQLTADQYATINRDVSRKLYDEVTDPMSVDDDARRLWEKKATTEVARAVAELKA